MPEYLSVQRQEWNYYPVPHDNRLQHGFHVMQPMREIIPRPAASPKVWAFLGSVFSQQKYQEIILEELTMEAHTVVREHSSMKWFSPTVFGSLYFHFYNKTRDHKYHTAQNGTLATIMFEWTCQDLRATLSCEAYDENHTIRQETVRRIVAKAFKPMAQFYKIILSHKSTITMLITDSTTSNRLTHIEQDVHGKFMKLMKDEKSWLNQMYYTNTPENEKNQNDDMAQLASEIWKKNTIILKHQEKKATMRMMSNIQRPQKYTETVYGELKDFFQATHASQSGLNAVRDILKKRATGPF